jgi:Mn2+/Fe2+ NRAMP family transporter
MMILDLGGREFNPIVRSVMALNGDKFWIWKFLMASGSLVLLFLHRGFKPLRRIIIVIASIYFIIVLYQFFLITTLRSH